MFCIFPLIYGYAVRIIICHSLTLSSHRKLDPEIEVNYKSRALLTLLLAKAVSVRGVERSPQYKFNLNVGNNSGYLTKQLLLAQTIELIYGASVFHSTGIAPLRPRSDTADTKSLDSVVKGNRVAVLTGDYMFASATKNLVKLKNSRVSDLMSKAVRDFVEGEYLNMKAREDIESGNWSDLLDNWVRITTLKSCSLIANGCQSMAHLTTNCETVEEQLYKFGYNVGYAWNVTEELDNFHRLRNQNKSRANTDLMFSLPMLLHFKSNPGLKASISSCDSIKTFIDNVSQAVITTMTGPHRTGSAFGLVFNANLAHKQCMCCRTLTAKTSIRCYITSTAVRSKGRK